MRKELLIALVIGYVIFTLGAWLIPECDEGETLVRGLFWFECVKT